MDGNRGVRVGLSIDMTAWSESRENSWEQVFISRLIRNWALKVWSSKKLRVTKNLAFHSLEFLIGAHYPSESVSLGWDGVPASCCVRWHWCIISRNAFHRSCIWSCTSEAILIRLCIGCCVTGGCSSPSFLEKRMWLENSECLISRACRVDPEWYIETCRVTVTSSGF